MMAMNRSGLRRNLTSTVFVLITAMWTIAVWAGGPSAQDTVRFLDQKFKEHGGGFVMVVDNEQGARYTRIFPVSLSMARDGYLILETSEQTIIEEDRLSDEEINSKLKSLDRPHSVSHRYEIPLEKMDFGWLSNRRGDWRARKTLKKSTGKIRILCQEKVNCIKINQLPNGHYIDLYVDDETQREKIFKAIKHLIGLYQHRKELF